jgi:hypothetical protein
MGISRDRPNAERRELEQDRHEQGQEPGCGLLKTSVCHRMQPLPQSTGCGGSWRNGGLGCPGGWFPAIPIIQMSSVSATVADLMAQMKVGRCRCVQ